jgi:hypothetical protein
MGHVLGFRLEGIFGRSVDLVKRAVPCLAWKHRTHDSTVMKFNRSNRRILISRPRPRVSLMARHLDAVVSHQFHHHAFRNACCLEHAHASLRRPSRNDPGVPSGPWPHDRRVRGRTCYHTEMSGSTDHLHPLRDAYDRSGVREYWLVDPEQRAVEVYHAKDGRFVLRTDRGSERLESLVLAGFQVEVASLFDPSQVQAKALRLAQ